MFPRLRRKTALGPLADKDISSSPLEPLNARVSRPRPPTIVSLPSPGFQAAVSSPFPSTSRSVPTPPLTKSAPLPPTRTSRPAPVVAMSLPLPARDRGRYVDEDTTGDRPELVVARPQVHRRRVEAARREPPGAVAAAEVHDDRVERGEVEGDLVGGVGAADGEDVVHDDRSGLRRRRLGRSSGERGARDEGGGGGCGRGPPVSLHSHGLLFLVIGSARADLGASTATPRRRFPGNRSATACVRGPWD